jgi:hypothetical protein
LVEQGSLQAQVDVHQTRISLRRCSRRTG